MNLFKLIEEHGLTLHGDIEHFAELVRQDEREACAKLCEEKYEYYGHDHIFAAAIRARGDKHE